MNYQTIEIDGRKLFLDISARRTACRNCGRLIGFAQDDKGNYYPVDKLFNKFVFHGQNCKKIKATDLEKRIESEDRKQEYLNKL